MTFNGCGVCGGLINHNTFYHNLIFIFKTLFCAFLVCLHYRILGGKRNQFPAQNNNLFDFNESVDVKPYCSILFSVVCEKEKGNTA